MANQMTLLNYQQTHEHVKEYVNKWYSHVSQSVEM